MSAKPISIVPTALQPSVRIFQLLLQARTTQFVRLPRDSKILAIQNIGGMITMVFVANTREKVLEEYRIDLNSTGQAITYPSKAAYLGTFNLTASRGDSYTLSAFITKASTVVKASGTPKSNTIQFNYPK